MGTKAQIKKAKQDANACMGIGVGAGVIGLTGAAIGAICPLCIVVAPSLLGYGAYKRYRASIQTESVTQSEPEDSV